MAQAAGPVSTSETTADVWCTGAATACGGSTAAATSARDTAVAPEARGTSTTSECGVTGGACQGTSTSAASSAPDHVTIDPETGKPVAGQQLTGPSSASRSDATLDCKAGANCSGTVTTTTTAYDGTVAKGAAPRTSTGTATCAAGTGGCQVRSTSTAASAPGAALALSGDQQATNAARLPAGASAASVAGAVLLCEGATTCNGKVTSAVTATDPTTSPNPRGSSSEGICEGVTGGICQAVTNSGASTGPDANRIAPIMTAAPTKNATVTTETTGDQPAEQQGAPGQDPATPPAPTAPGSSANSGGPTVPGASSWSMADATLDCAGAAGGCAGTARSSAAGSDGPDRRRRGERGPWPPDGWQHLQWHLRDVAVRVPGQDQLLRGVGSGRCRHRRRAEQEHR